MQGHVFLVLNETGPCTENHFSWKNLPPWSGLLRIHTNKAGNKLLVQGDTSAELQRRVDGEMRLVKGKSVLRKEKERQEGRKIEYAQSKVKKLNK